MMNKMINKNERMGRVFRYVGVTAFAVVAMGVFVSGAANHKGNKPVKEVVTITAEKVTDMVETTTEEVKTDDVKYTYIFEHVSDENGPEREPFEIGKATFKIKAGFNDDYVYVKGENSKKFKKVCYCRDDVYSDGEFVYYITYDENDNEVAMRYDIENDKHEEVDR